MERLGKKLKLCQGHCDTFPVLIYRIFGDGLFAHKFEGVLHLAIASSTLGAAYGILFSNCWNLHTLAQNGHISFAPLFANLNGNLVPVACVIVEGLLCLAYLFVSQGVLIPLQQIGALGCVISYTISVGALILAAKNHPINPWIPRLGLFSCAILLTACIRSFFLNGMSSLIIFASLLLLGFAMYYATSRKTKANIESVITKT